jgi:DNA polymerase-3 subunit gamma/tau
MSLALYRLYRPSRLSEVIGQEHVTQPLARALSGNNVHHAFLFSGPRGCGKTSTARILARSLICEQGPTPEPCGECEFCVSLAPNGPGLVDVIELDAASHGGVDDTRELRERAAFVPAQARFKVYIIDEAHMVSKDGFNALLKLIEEPPDHLKFIFATTEVDKVIPTIRSRTFNYAFRLVPSRQLQQNLAMICDSEGVRYEPAALSLIARASGGSVRDAQSIMGQLIAGSGSEGLRQSEVGEQLGVTDEALLDDVVGAVAQRDGAALFSAVNRVIESGHDVRRFVTDLLHQIRDLLLITHSGEAATEDVLDVSADRLEVLVAQTQFFGATELTRLAEVVSEGLTQVKGSTSPRLQLEVLVARLLIPAADTNPESLLARVEVLERRLSAVASGVGRPTGTHTRVPPEATLAAGAAASGSGATAETGPESEPTRVASAGGPSQGTTAASPASRSTPAAATKQSDPAQSSPAASVPTALRQASEPARPPATETVPATPSALREARVPPGSNPKDSGSGPPRRPAMSSLGQSDRSANPSGRQPAPAGQPGRSAPAVQSVESDPTSQSGVPAPTKPKQTVEPSTTRSGQPPMPEPTQGSQSVPDSSNQQDQRSGQRNQAPTIEQIRSIWPDLMSQIREKSRVAAASWEGAEPTSLADGALNVHLPTQGQEVSIRSSRRELAMRSLLIEQFGIDVQVNPVAGNPGGNAPKPDTPADDDPDLGSDDLSGVDLAMRELGATQIGEIEGG